LPHYRPQAHFLEKKTIW